MPWFLIAYFNLSLATHISDENFFLPGNFRCSTEKAAILLLSQSTLYISFSMQKMSLILLVDFDLTLVAQIPCLKLICFWILCAPRKRHRYFAFCKAPYIYLVFSMWKLSWFLIVDFTLSQITQIPPAKRLYSQSSRCSAKKAVILIWHPEKWPESWLIFICHGLQGFRT